MKQTLRYFFAIAIPVLLAQSCQKFPAQALVTLTTLNINSGPANTAVVITGTGFSTASVNDHVFFNGKSATIVTVTDTQITALVPQGAGTGPVTVSVGSAAAILGPVFTYIPTANVTTIGTFSNVSFWGIAVDAAGTSYVTDLNNSIVDKVTAAGALSSFAKNVTGQTPYFTSPTGMIRDAAGNFYVASSKNIVKISATGAITVTTIAQANQLCSVVMDGSGNLYTADLYGSVIYKTTPAGVSTVFVGSGTSGSADGVGTAATLNYPIALTIDGAGNIYDMDAGSYLVRKISPVGVVTTLAGSGSQGATNGKGSAASFSAADGLAVDAAGNVYVADTGNGLIRKIAPDGTVTTLAGSGAATDTDGIGTAASFHNPQGVTIDASGNLYVVGDVSVRKITLQ